MSKANEKECTTVRLCDAQKSHCKEYCEEAVSSAACNHKNLPNQGNPGKVDCGGNQCASDCGTNCDPHCTWNGKTPQTGKCVGPANITCKIVDMRGGCNIIPSNCEAYCNQYHKKWVCPPGQPAR